MKTLSGLHCTAVYPVFLLLQVEEQMWARNRIQHAETQNRCVSCDPDVLYLPYIGGFHDIQTIAIACLAG